MDKLVRKIEVPLAKKRMEEAGLYLVDPKELENTKYNIKDLNEISAIGHRVLHGAEKYNSAVLIDEEVMQDIKDNIHKLAKEKNIGWLKVSFFWFFYNDYKIIYADEKFNNIIVTGKNKDYFWILCNLYKKTPNQTQVKKLRFSRRFPFIYGIIQVVLYHEDNMISIRITKIFF